MTMIRFLFFLFLITTAISACKLHNEHINEGAIDPVDLVGKTIVYRYGESVYHLTIDGPSDLHWEAIAGEEKGAYEKEKYKIVSIDDRKLFITWGEANGIGVSQVLDFDKGIVYNHLLRGREVSIGEGEIHILESSE